MVRAWWVIIINFVLVIDISWSNKEQNLVTFASSRGASTSSNIQIGEGLDKKIAKINEIAVKNSLLQKDDKVINLTSMPIEKKGMVNTVRVSKI